MRSGLLLAAVLTACSGRIDDTTDAAMSGELVKNPPWLMWGNKQTIEVPLRLGTLQQTGGQLLKIAYARPESWRFLFMARIIAAPITNVNPHPATQIMIDFNVWTGIGRGTADIKRLPQGTNQAGFERYIFAGAPLDPLAANAFKWSTSVYGPPRDDVHQNPPSNFTDVIVGQDIQVNVQIAATCSNDEPNLVLEVGAWFAPNTHIRPEWMVHQTLGQHEDQGR